MSDTSNVVVAMQHISKRFPGALALDDVDLELHGGEVHGLVGENGAGKSTLMRMLSGVYTPDAGTIIVAGKPVSLRHPVDAQRRGIAMIHQELNLVDELSVVDNIFLGREKCLFGFVRRRAAYAVARQMLARLGCNADPRAKVKSLSIGRRQMVEIAKALSMNARVVIMDEPTAVLSRREADALMTVIGELRRAGVTIVYISHLLPEVLRLCDRITVMRDGKVVTELHEQRLRQTDERALASLMVGRPMQNYFPPRKPAGNDVVLKVKHLSVPGYAEDISFTVNRGEILGFAGLIGAGRTEMAEAIAGLRYRGGGEIGLHGKRLHITHPAHAVRAGIAYLSEDRKNLGLTLGMGISHNIIMVSLAKYARLFINHRAETAAAAKQVESLQIKIGSLRDRVDTLSGGNQQKVALAKWLETAPRVLIIDEPTRGVDIGAKEQIYALIQNLTQQGMATILISSELNEILGLSHRIAVMRSGKLVATVLAADANEELIMRYAALG